MTKTIYILTHIDEPAEDIVNTFADPYDGFKNQFNNLEDAQKELEEYLQQGLEYTIRTVRISVD